MASMSLQAAYDQARQWLESNDLDRATGLAEHILEHYPNNLEAYRILGEVYLANRQLDRAQEAFERVLRSDPENIPAHVGMGITYERQGKLDRAVAEFEQALEIKPDMAELRSQLLRLYTDAWGSEHAQLRLSRAGLARLYAKGHMLPQAISEFRQVIAEQPDRFDAMVALAETLWRDGQEDEAIALCRDILARRPESLKANLILGYLQMASGSPDGDRYWQAAQRMDPYHGVARALFETLPPGSDQQPEIEEWDEAAWRRRRAEELQEHVPATRQMEVIAPVGATSNADVSGGGWYSQPPPRPAAALTSPVDSDDFLASLLALDMPASPPASPPTPVTSDEDLGLDLDIDMAPFSLEDLDREDGTMRPAPAQPAPLLEDEPAIQPFSLADLGLSDEEIAGLESLDTPSPLSAQVEPPARQEQPPTREEQPLIEDEPTMQPFSLADLGLSDEEIAGLGIHEPSTPLPAQMEPPARQEQPPTREEQPLIEDEPTMQPFSLADLGLSDEEIAGLGIHEPSTPLPAQVEPPTRQEQPPAREEQPLIEDEPTIQPFSLADLGLSDEEIAGLESLEAPRPTPMEPRAIEPFSFDPPVTPRSSAAQPPAEDESDLDLPLDLQPFSFDELDLGDDSPSRGGLAGLPSALQPFSLEDTPKAPSQPQRPRVSGFSPEEPLESVAEEEDVIPDTRGYSWQQPSHKSQTGFSRPKREEREEPAGADASIFSKMKQRREAEPVEPPPELADVSLGEDEHLGLFSLDDIPLREDAEAATLASAAAHAEIAPAEQVQDVEAAPPSSQQPPPEVEDLDAALAAGQVQPFSLADLGLSDEEIAALGLGGTGDALAPQEVAPPAADTTPPAPPAPTGKVRELDLDLDDQFDFDTPAAAPPTPSPAASKEEEVDEGPLSTSELQPFSLADLGLSDEEIAALGLGPMSEPDEPVTSELGITEEELEGLDLGDLSWGQPAPVAEVPQASAPSEPHLQQPQVTSGDLVVDRLIALGRQQGYVDISDIIAGVEDPEAEAARIEEIGQRLHEANIEIRDGDEVIDMDAEYAEEEEFVAEIDEPSSGMPAPVAEEPTLTPFSLSELGLSDEEIAALGLGEVEAAPPQPPAQDEEPVLTPFSLSDLGLSDEEIAALGLGEDEQAAAPEAVAPGQPEAPAAPTPTQDEEPVLTPFSLSELGLTDEDVATLGLGEDVQAVAPAETPEAVPVVPAQDEEPALIPFSLSELGLSDEEIAALGMGEVEQAAAPEAALGEPDAPAAPVPVQDEEPVLTPFSLSDLGLSDEEIAAIGGGEFAAGAVERATPANVSGAEVPSGPPSVAIPPETPPMAADAGERQAEPVTPARSEQPTAPEAVVVSPPVTPVEERRPQAGAPVHPVAEPPASQEVAPTISDGSAGASTGNSEMDAYLRILEAEPQNHVLRLSVARAGVHTGMSDLAVQQYKQLIKYNAMLDEIVDDLHDLIAEVDDRKVLRRLHRTLGDVYSKQGRLREAITEYNWTA